MQPVDETSCPRTPKKLENGQLNVITVILFLLIVAVTGFAWWASR